MNQHHVVVFGIIIMLALCACTVPPKSTPTTNGSLPEIDDVGLTQGIDAATGALGVDNATTVSTPVTPVAPTPTPSDSNVIKKTVTEGDIVSFPNLKATDPDGLPVTYAFTKPLDAQGKWQTKVGDAGEYPVTISATDGKSTIQQKLIIVVKSANRPPVISGPSTFSAMEGENFVLNLTVTDPENQKVTVTYGGWMTSPIKSVAFGDAGDHTVVVTASDGVLTTSRNITVSVEKVNRAPVIKDIEPITAVEGDKITVVPDAFDPDGNKISYTFTAPLDTRGVWQTKPGDAGSYVAVVTVSDGTLEDSTKVAITIKALNKPPVISNFADLSVNEGDLITLSPSVTDPEGSKVTLVYSGWMDSATKQTGYTDSGKYQVTLTATDTSGATTTKTITITVNDVNRPPVFDPGSFS